MSSTSPKEKSQASDVATSSASLSQVASKKEAQSLNRNDSDKTSSLSSVNPTQLPLSASSTISKKTTIDTLITLGADRPSTATVLRAGIYFKMLYLFIYLLTKCILPFIRRGQEAP